MAKAWRLASMLTMIAFASVPGDASAVVCKSKKGRLTIREACKKKETAVGLSDVFGPQPQPAVIASAATVTDSSTPAKEVGVVVGVGYYGGATVLRKIGNDFFSLPVTRDGFDRLDDDFSFFVYRDAGCTGPGFVYAGYGAADPSHLSRPLFVSQDASKGYSPLPTAPEDIEPAEYRGFYDSSSSGAFLGCGGAQQVGAVSECDVEQNCGRSTGSCFCVHCCYTYGYGTPSAPVETIDLQQLGLTPPFAIAR